VLNILLQILDDGRLTDATGRTVDFKNTVVIMTSNLGTSEISKNLGFDSASDESDYERMREKLLRLFKNTFRLEFVNRLNEIIVFRRLTRPLLAGIVGLVISQVVGRLQDKKITVELTEDAKNWIIDKGFDITFGARPLKRIVKRYVEEPLAEEILRGQLAPGSKVLLDRPSMDGADKLTIHVTVPEAPVVEKV
jgi:ATP-dependent Clp protease ATP-binding subunit ClpC